MRLITLLFFFCVSNAVLHSQDRLTSITNEVLNESIYIQEFNGLNYVLKTNPTDELKVFRLYDDFSTELLYTNIFKNIYDNFFVFIIEDNIYFSDGLNPVKYNFVANKETRYVLPEGWFPQIWFNPGSKLPSITTTNATNDDHKTFILTESGEVLDDDEVNGYGRVIEDYIIKTTPRVNNRSSLFVENIDNGQKDTLVFNSLSFKMEVDFYGKNLIFVNDEGRFCKFEGATGNISHIPNLIYDSNEHDAFQWIENHLAILKEDTDEILLYNSLDGQLTHSFNFEDFHFSLDNLSSLRKVEDRLIIQDHSEMATFDLTTSEVKGYPIYSSRFTLYPLIDNRYFISFDFEIIDDVFTKVTRLVDLKDGSTNNLDYQNELYFLDYANVISVGEEFLGVFWAPLGLSPDHVFRIDPENLSMSHLPSIQPKSTVGLPSEGTVLYELGENVAFVSEDNPGGVGNIYSVEGDQVNLVLSDTIYDFYPSGFIKLKDRVTYATEKDDYWQIFSFDGKDLNQEATFPIPSTFMGTGGFLEKYVLTENNVFAVIQNFGYTDRTNLFRYDKVEESVEHVSILSDNIIDIPLVTDGENTYFYSASTLYHLDGNGMMEEMISVSEPGITTGTLVQGGDDTYFITFDGVFLLDGKEAIHIYKGRIDDQLFTLSLSVEFQNFDQTLLIDISDVGEDILLYLDGSTARVVNTGAGLSSLVAQENNFFHITTNHLNGARKYLLYDGSEDKLYDLTYLNHEERFLNLHELNNTSYIMTYERFAEILNIYRMSEDYSTADLVFTSPVNSFTTDPNFKVLDEEGMLYSNDFIFQIDEGYQFHKVEVMGNGSTPEMVLNDGYIYFIATDEELGNQLYRVLLVSLRVAVDEIQSIDVFKVNPNPATNFISVPNNLSGAFTIFNEAGQILMNGELQSSQINISQLPIGLHSLQIVSDKNIYISRFAKIN